MAGLWMTMFTF